MTQLMLTRPHTHAGRFYSPGDRLDVATDTADWLIAQGVARLVPEPTKPRSGPEPKIAAHSPTPSPEEPQP
jgi:hypothetical protein